jgi:hypothetical protein
MKASDMAKKAKEVIYLSEREIGAVCQKNVRQIQSNSMCGGDNHV